MVGSPMLSVMVSGSESFMVASVPASQPTFQGDSREMIISPYPLRDVDDNQRTRSDHLRQTRTEVRYV